MARISLPSPNWSARPEGAHILMLILHSGEGTRESDLATLRDDTVPIKNRRSAHAYACRNGDLITLVDDAQEAWHAGLSYWQGYTNVNPWSLGLETEHHSGQDWPQVQRDTIAQWSKDKIRAYTIAQPMVAAHRWISPGRKFDPSDWPDAELHAFIAQLYVNRPDYHHEWGDRAPFIPTWGIPQWFIARCDAARSPGQAQGPERVLPNGETRQDFESAVATWRQDRGVVSLDVCRNQ